MKDSHHNTVRSTAERLACFLATCVLVGVFLTSCNQGTSSAPPPPPPPPESLAANPGGPYVGNVGQTITFDGSKSTAPTGQTLTYAWNFGDNSTGTGVSPTHLYSTAGTFTVSLTVTDTSGGTNSLSTNAIITALPVANPGGPYNGNVGQTITFDGSKSTAPSGQTLTYAWNFGDNSTGTGVSPTHAYSTAGTFTVALTVTDTSGATNTLSTTATISALPVANPGGPYNGNVGQTITFDGSKSTAPSGQTLTYAWNFGDNSTGSGVSPTHAYSTAGTFAVSLTVTDTSGGTNTLSTTAIISALPVANPGGPYSGIAGQTITFDGSKSTAPTGQTLTYAWNFGDNSTGAGVSPTHAYSAVGVFTVALTVTDTSGGTNTNTTTATVGSGGAPSITSFTPTSGTIGTQVTITGVNLAPAPLVTLAQQGGGSIGASVVSSSLTSITFIVPAGAATGPLTVTVGAQSAASTSSFTVVASSSFTVNAAPNTVTVVQGQSAAFSVALSSTNGFGQLAALSVSGLPTGITATFSPTQITAGQTSVLTLTAPSGQPTGTATLMVMATATVQGILQAPTAPPVTLNVQGLSTSFLGRTVVDDSRETPVAGVTIKFLGVDDKSNATGCAGQTVSDAGGNFLFSSLPAACTGPQLISYDGSTATAPPGKYAGVNLSYTLTSGQVTTSPVLIHLPRIDNAETVNIQQNAPVDQVFTFQTIPTLQVTVYAGTMFTLDDGSQPNPFPLVAISIPIDRLPDMMPSSGMLTPFIVAFQPANAVASQPVAVTFPNPLNVASGTAATFMTLDPTHGYMVPYGTGTVSPDGTQFNPDPDPAHPGHSYGLVHFDWHGPAPPPPNRRPPSPCASACCGPGPPPPPPPPAPPQPGPPSKRAPEAGMSVDLSSGIEVLRATDIAINGGRQPVAISRVYVSSSTNSGPFGIGTSHNYGYVLDAFSFLRGNGAFLNLNMPDGNQYAFAEKGTGTFVNSTVPMFLGAVLTITNPLTGTYILRWNDGTTFTFQASAQGLITAYLSSIQDRNGNTITLVHGNSAQPALVTQVVDTVGRSLNLTYDGSNRITSITDPIGRSVSYTYNSQGTLATVTDLAGGVTAYGYDSQNRLNQITDPRGVVIAQETYDANGRVIQEVEADGGILKFAYTLMNPMVSASPVLQTLMTDALGNQTTYRFDASQFLSDVTDASGQTTHFSRSAQQNNRATAITGSATCPICGDPGSGDLAFTFDSNGNILTREDALGNTTTYTYDPVFNQITSATDPLGNVSKYVYDSRGNRTSVVDPDGNTTSFAYNSFGQVTQVTDPVGGKTLFSYDTFGNLFAVTDPVGNTAHFIYDAVSRNTGTVDPLGATNSIAYDQLDRRITQADAKGGTIHFSYDPVGNLLSLTDETANKTSFTYDVMSRVVSKTDPRGKTQTASYDLNGNLVSFVDRRGQTSTYSYDALNRLTGQKFQDGSSVSGSYDARGHLVRAVDSVSGTFDFAYDAIGRGTSSSSQFGTTQYSYDAAGRVSSLQVVGQSAVTYSYDAAGNLLSAAQTQASATLSYDARNKLTGITRGNAISSQYAYDAAEQLLSLTHSGGQGVQLPLTYSYDARNNRSSYTTNFALPQPLANTFDQFNRLVQSGTTSYTYDDNGNLTSTTGSTGTTNYTWDARNRLNSISAPSGQKTTFLYDFTSNLISQIDSGPSLSLTQNFVLDDLTNIAYINRSNGDSVSVLAGRSVDQDVAVVHAAGQVEYGLPDAMNSTVATVDQNGKLASSFSYEPFGKTTTASSYPFQFSGRLPVTAGLYYYRARYYSPCVGRFISEDPIGFAGGYTLLYKYVGNNPTNVTDPNGLNVTDCVQTCVLLISGAGSLATKTLGPASAPLQAAFHLATIPGCFLGCLSGPSSPPPEPCSKPNPNPDCFGPFCGPNRVPIEPHMNPD